MDMHTRSEVDLQAEIVVMGGGIAGLSLVSELSRRRSTGRGVVLVEAESALAQHTSRRSAQHLIPSYGPAPVRELTTLTVTRLLRGLELLETPVVWPCPTVLFGTRTALAAEFKAAAPPSDAESSNPLQEITRQHTLELCPELSRVPSEDLHAGLLDDTSVRSDAFALMEWHRTLAEAAGARILTDSPVTAAQHDDDGWVITAGDRLIRTRLVVNATGAWADAVGGIFGAAALGLQPLRRTAAIVELETPLPEGHPVVVNANGDWYYRQDPEGALISTGEAEPEDPCDARPHPGQVEALVDELNAVTDLRITGIRRAWTGQRTAAPDGVPVCGFDPTLPGFLWLAGQSGYGFQTSTALARAAADLLLEDLIGTWCTLETAEALDPARFR